MGEDDGLELPPPCGTSMARSGAVCVDPFGGSSSSPLQVSLKGARLFGAGLPHSNSQQLESCATFSHIQINIHYGETRKAPIGKFINMVHQYKALMSHPVSGMAFCVTVQDLQELLQELSRT